MATEQSQKSQVKHCKKHGRVWHYAVRYWAQVIRHPGVIKNPLSTSENPILRRRKVRFVCKACQRVMHARRKRKKAKADKAWALANPDKVKAAQRKYYLRNKERRHAASRRWRQRKAAADPAWAAASLERLKSWKKKA